MSTPKPAAGSSSAHAPLANPSAGANGSPRWLDSYPWATFVVPFVVFMLVTSLEPTPDKPFELLGLSIPYSAYPLVYSAKIVLTMVAMAAVWRGYRQFAFRVSPLALVVGVVGVVLWIGICKLDLENKLLGPLGLGSLIDLGKRSAFNPLEAWPDKPLA